MTETQYATVDTASVVIYVDGEKRPVTTKTFYNTEAAATPTQASPSSDDAPSSAPKPTSSKAPTSSTPQAQSPKPIVQPPQPSSPPASDPAPPPVQSAEPVKPSPIPDPPKPEEPVKSSPIPEPPKSSPIPDPPKPAESVAPPQSSKPAPPVNQPSVAPAKSPVEQAPGPSSDFGAGISYSPYNADNTCKSAEQVAADFQMIRGYSLVRLYGTDCDQVANVLAAIRGKGISLFVGIFDITKVQDECQTLIEAVNGDWGSINAVSVGNELLNQGKASVGQVTAAIGQVRDTLKGAGYSGPVVTVDTMVAMKANPELCHASDFCAINCHAFFDGNVVADAAGDFVQQWADLISEAANGKTVIVTESGWPSQGEVNNKAVPSKENQAAAIDSIRLKLGKNVILYNAFNDLWKVDRGDTFGAEKYWGIFGDAPSHVA